MGPVTEVRLRQDWTSHACHVGHRNCACVLEMLLQAERAQGWKRDPTMAEGPSCSPSFSRGSRPTLLVVWLSRSPSLGARVLHYSSWSPLPNNLLTEQMRGFTEEWVGVGRWPEGEDRGAGQVGGCPLWVWFGDLDPTLPNAFPASIPPSLSSPSW